MYCKVPKLEVNNIYRVSYVNCCGKDYSFIGLCVSDQLSNWDRPVYGLSVVDMMDEWCTTLSNDSELLYDGQVNLRVELLVDRNSTPAISYVKEAYKRN